MQYLSESFKLKFVKQAVGEYFFEYLKTDLVNGNFHQASLFLDYEGHGCDLESLHTTRDLH